MRNPLISLVKRTELVLVNSRFYGSVILFLQNPFDFEIPNLDVDGHNVISFSATCYNEK